MALDLYAKGAKVWIRHPEVVWEEAEVVERSDDQLVVKPVEEGEEEQTISVKSKEDYPPLKNPDILIGENDLTSLSYLHEPAVLHNLEVRFVQQNSIYTYCGIVLVAINPYERLPIYGNDIIQVYKGQSISSVDPHVYAVAEQAYRQMARDKLNQSVIISGESGAGKTVSAKFSMRYFAAVGGAEGDTRIEDKVLASNPVMESLGNAKTTRNDNSSRFGKYIELSFDKRNHIMGANMRTYLLEKTRVVFQAEEERNYHIFYQLCAMRDEPELEDLQLLSCEEFVYTQGGECPEVAGMDDKEEFRAMQNALTVIGVKPDVQRVIFRILAAILHMGNITYKKKSRSSDDASIPSDDAHFPLVASLLGVDKAQLLKWLCNRKIQTGRETMVSPLNITNAMQARDALAKHTYSQLFNWVVNVVNGVLRSGKKQTSFIGVLDIYGFEIFKKNSFEQFCINFANEMLQQQFTQHVFKLEQEEYLAEQIKWSMIDYADNEPCIELISHQKNGIIAMLDEECKLPRGSDDNWGEKLIKAHSACTFFRKPKVGRETFVIVHFAAPVEYTTNGFMDKNKDAMNEEHLHLLRASEFALVGELFEDKKEPEPAASAATSKTRTLRAGTGGTSGASTRKSVRGGPGGSGGGGKRSVGSQFRDSLTALMETLNSTTPNYIRCIKPNDFKAAFEFDPNRAVEQLRACGVLETIRISSAGYPSRWSYRDFFARYGFLVEKKKLKSDPRASTEIITQLLINDEDKYQFGKNKVFFRAGQVAYLERLRGDKLNRAGVIIQKTMRAYVERKKYVKIRRMALYVQARLRGKLARKHCQFLRETKAATTVQTAFRSFIARKKYQRTRAAIQLIQRVTRGMFGRREFRQRLRNTKAVVIQSCVRGWLQRVRYTRTMRGIVLLQSCWRRRKAKQQLKQLKMEARSVGKLKELNKGMEMKVIQLQQRIDDQSRENKNLEKSNTMLNEELNKLRQSTSQQASSNQDSKAIIKEHQEELTRLREALQAAETELSNTKQAKERLVAAHQDEKNSLMEEMSKVQSQMKEAKEAAVAATAAAAAAAATTATSSATRSSLTRQMSNKRADSTSAVAVPEIISSHPSSTPVVENALNEEMLVENDRLRAQLEEERQHHQSMLKEHNRLQQRYENLEEELSYVNQHGTGVAISPSMSMASIAPSERSSFSHSPNISTVTSPMPISEPRKTLPSIESQPMVLSTTSAHTEIAALKQTNAVLQNELDKTCAALNVLRTQRRSITSGSTVSSSMDDESIEQEAPEVSQHNANAVGDFEIRLQQEVTRLTAENLDLQEEVERLQERLAAKNGAGGLDEPSAEPSPFMQVSPSTISTRVQSQFRGLLRYEPSDEPLLVKRLILEMKPQQMVGKLPCLPATMLFMCLRYLDDINDERRVQSLLTAAISSIRKVIKKQSKDLELRIFWLSNVTSLLTYMKQYSGEKAFLPEDESLAGFCLNNFDLTDYRLVLNDLSVSLYQDAVSIFKAKIQPMISGAMLEHGIPGMWPSKPNFSRGKEQSVTYTPSDILSEFNTLMVHMVNHCLDKDIIDQMFKQVMALINAFMLNNMLLRKDLCHLSRGPQIRYNLSQLEEWCYEKLAHPPSAISQLNPITQAAQLLQINKQNPSDVDAIVELCHSLNPLQIQKLLTMYTPTSEFEKRVPASVIKAVNAYFKGRVPDPGRLMMDVDKTMAVSFNHRPIDRDLRDVAVPEDLDLKFVRRT